jgi:hypothetical protein
MCRYTNFPPEFRFNPKYEAKVNLLTSFAHFSYIFGFTYDCIALFFLSRSVLFSTTNPLHNAYRYPILGGIFFNSDVLIQSCIIPLFFIQRASYEYGADAMTSKTFGSDGMPVICLIGVALHEICLTLMMTSISHPSIFGMLILCDVVENTYCLWSLYRTMNVATSNKVVPQGDGLPSLRKTLTKRSSSVHNLVRDIDHSTSMQERQGTALFIAATLLQREMIETFVPIQAIGIISILHKLNVKSNSVVSGWTSNDEYQQTMVYMGIDLGVEIVVFVLTIVTLRKILPVVSAWRVLYGLVKMHFFPMVLSVFGTWYVALLFQSAHVGMDTTFRFSWLKCGGKENPTWLGGFNWEC